MCTTHKPVVTVSLLTDSVGRLKSRGKEYIEDVQTHVAFQGNIIIKKKQFIGGDLPEVAGYLGNSTALKESGHCDLNLIILMSNYAASTLGQCDISHSIVQACHRLQQIAESVPTYVIYGGPGDMWRHVVSSGEQICFETKTQRIRELLASSGNVKVMSGVDDFRAFFVPSDLDHIGHIKGVARHKAIQWMTKQLMDASNYFCQVMKPNMQNGLAPVEDPLATKHALIGFTPLPQVPIPDDWLPRTLSNARPHVFLLSGPDRKCAAQQEAAENMFKQLGWEPKLVWGIQSDVQLPHRRSHWAWACCFLPKLIQIIAASTCNDDEVLLLGEESCWPTNSCTPQLVREWMKDAQRQGYQGMWIGACGGMRLVALVAATCGGTHAGTTLVVAVLAEKALAIRQTVSGGASQRAAPLPFSSQRILMVQAHVHVHH